MNTSYSYGERSIYIAIVISLLLHASLIVYFAITDNTHRTLSIKEEELLAQELAQKKDAEWVETKTRASYGDAPIFFRDDYSEASKEEVAEQPHDMHEEQPAEQLIKTEVDVDATTIQMPTPQRASSFAKAWEDRQQPTPQQQLIPTIKPMNSTKGNPIQQKKLPSLAQLTRGVMNYMQENGSHSVSMLGKKNGTPTDEQLKYERYLERLNQCLHNSFVINAHKHPPYSPDLQSVTVYLALNEDGSIYNLKLVKSCGNHSFDLFVMSILRDASSSFPPVPHYLPHNPFSIHYIIHSGPPRYY